MDFLILPAMSLTPGFSPVRECSTTSRNRFNDFPFWRETVETVNYRWALLVTGLKPGVNETRALSEHARLGTLRHPMIPATSGRSLGFWREI
jgi:hypothetical protein